MNRRRLLGTAVVTAALTLAYTVGGPYLDDLLPEEYTEALAQVTGPPAAPSPAAQQPLPPGPIDAEPGPGDAGADANPHQLPAFAAGPARVAEPRRYPDPSLFGQLKAAANRQSAAASKPGGSTTPATASTPRFPTLGYADGGSWNPPDGALAVGPTSVLAAVNESFAIYTKSTGAPAVPPKGLPSFFGTTDSVFDPRALYDAGNAASGGYGGGQGRFVLLASSENERTRTSTFMLAVSRNATPESPTSGWCTYRLNAAIGSGGSATWADFPGLGMDGDNLYISSNQYTFGRNVSQYARILVIPKQSVYPATTGGACPTATSWDFRDLRQPNGTDRSFAVQPAHQPDALPGQTSAARPGSMYFVNALWPSGSNLVVRSITTTARGAKPTLNTARFVDTGYIGSYDVPADAPQPGGNAIDTGDTRLLGAAFRYGVIYTANTIQHVGAGLSSTPNPYANVQWYEITPSGSASSGQTFTVTDPTQAYYFPAVMPGCTTTSCTTPSFVGLVFSGSGPTAGQEASAFSAARTSGGVTVKRYQPGVAGYTLNSRWGDYPATAADGGSVWVLAEYAQATNAWGTAVDQVVPGGP